MKDVIWTNKKEIPNNGIDDDNNGFIDDIHGWNFIGNSKGENIKDESLELTRVYREMSRKFKDTILNSKIKDTVGLALYKSVCKEYKNKCEEQKK